MEAVNNNDDWGKVPSALFACHWPRNNVAMVIYIFSKIYIALFAHSRYSCEGLALRVREREKDAAFSLAAAVDICATFCILKMLRFQRISCAETEMCCQALVL